MTLSLEELLQREPDAETLTLWLKKVPYATYLGIEAEVRVDALVRIGKLNMHDVIRDRR